MKTPGTIAVLLTLAALTACRPPSPPPAPVPPAPADPGPITPKPDAPQSLVLTVGATRPISLPAGATLISSNPDIASVQGSAVTARRVGHVTLTVKGGAGTDPATVALTVVQEADGTTALPADAVLSTVQAGPLPTPGQTFEVDLKPGTPVTAGQVVYSSAGPFFAGRVTRVQQDAARVRVTLIRVKPAEVFRAFSWDARGQVKTTDAPSVAAIGAKSVRTLPDGSVRLTYNVPRVQALAQQEFPLGPLTCTASADVVINPSTVEIKVQAVMDFDLVLHDDEQGHARFRYKTSGQLTATLAGGLKVGANFAGKIECKKSDLITIPIPVSGPIAWFISPMLNLGLTMSASGTIGVGAADLGFQGFAKTNVDLGFEYLEGEGLNNLSSTGGSADFIPRLVYTGTPEATFKAELFAGPTATLAVGNAVASAELLSLSLGPVFEADLASPDVQVADPTYSSGYNLRLQAKLEPGSTVADLIKALVQRASTEIKESALSVTTEVPLSASPAGGAQADVRDYRPGEPVTVKANLDAATTHFLGAYNVDRVELYRLERSESGARTARRLVTAPATPNQETFTLKWTADQEGKVDGELFIFVRSALLPFVPMEVAGVTSAGLDVRPERAQIATDHDLHLTAVNPQGEPADVTWTADGGTVTPDGRFRAAAPGTYTVTATLKDGSSARSTIQVSRVQITPDTPTLDAGAARTFSLLVDGVTVKNVLWATTGGTVTAQGVLTAPTPAGTYVLTARTDDNPHLFATTSFTVSAGPTIPAVAGWTGTVTYRWSTQSSVTYSDGRQEELGVTGTLTCTYSGGTLNETEPGNYVGHTGALTWRYEELGRATSRWGYSTTEGEWATRGGATQSTAIWMDSLPRASLLEIPDATTRQDRRYEGSRLVDEQTSTSPLRLTTCLPFQLPDTDPDPDRIRFSGPITDANTTSGVGPTGTLDIDLVRN